MKEVNIKITLPDLQISEYEVQSIVREQVKDFLQANTKYSSLISSVIKEVIEEEVKSSKKEIKNKVKQYIQIMEGSSLYYNDKFREIVIELTKANKSVLEKRIIEHIKSIDYSRVIDACGSSMADDFYTFIRNKNN